MATTEMIDDVDVLNGEIYEILQDEDFCGFALRTSGMCTAIDFLGQSVWCSENDERGYDASKNDEKEPMEGFLRRKAMETINKISQLKF